MHFPTKFQFSKQSLEQWADTPFSSNKRRNLVKQQEVTDTKDNWLKAIRYPSGKVVLYLKGQFQHQTYRIRLGEHPSLNVVNARKRINEIRNLLYAGKDPSIELKKANMTLAKLADEYLRYERQRGKKSIKSDESRLKHHLLPKFGKRLISTITRKEVEQYHCELSAAKSASLANRILSLIKAMFTKACDWEYLDYSVVHGIKAFRENEGRIRYLTAGEYRRLWDVLSTDTKSPDACLLFKLLLLTGMRLSEAVHLTVDDYDGATSTIFLADGKTGGRWVQVNSLASQIVEGQLAKYGLNDKSGLLFRSSASNTRYANKVIGSPRHIWHRLLKEADISNFRIHDCRHQYATMALKHGSVTSVMRNLGHRNIKTTLRYAHTTDQELKACAQSVADSVNELIATN